MTWGQEVSYTSLYSEPASTLSLLSVWSGMARCREIVNFVCRIHPTAQSAIREQQCPTGFHGVHCAVWPYCWQAQCGRWFTVVKHSRPSDLKSPSNVSLGLQIGANGSSFYGLYHRRLICILDRTLKQHNPFIIAIELIELIPQGSSWHGNKYLIFRCISDFLFKCNQMKAVALEPDERGSVLRSANLSKAPW